MTKRKANILEFILIESRRKLAAIKILTTLVPRQAVITTFDMITDPGHQRVIIMTGTIPNHTEEEPTITPVHRKVTETETHIDVDSYSVLNDQLVIKFLGSLH
jgi:hypothetical protein